MSTKLNKAILKVAATNPNFAKLLKAELLNQRRRLAASDGVSIDDMGVVFVRRDAHAMLTEREAKTHWDLVNRIGSKVSAALKKAGIPHKQREARLSHDRLMRWQQMVVPNASLSSQSRDERNALIEQIAAALDASNIPYGFYRP